MVGDALHQKKVPWFTMLLVVGSTLCHLLVLIGNCATANVMNELGVSTGGWARVGRGLARSLKIELDTSMQQVSSTLVEGLGHLGFVHDSLDTLLALIPDNFTDGLPEQPVPREVLSLLQEQSGAIDPGVAAGLALVINDALNRTVSAVISQISVVLHRFLEVIRPALVQASEWITRVGNRIQAGIRVFSTTLDRVQKLFDQIMSHLAGRGENGRAMLDQAFGLFDASNTGSVTAEDLKEVGRLYRVTALLGKIPEELADRYDSSGDGRLDQDELALLLHDEALPNLMPVILRTYAKRLAEIGGNVVAARHRDEVAQTVFDYFALVCSKNASKVAWVSDRLGNGSLPVAFTADVMAQACLREDGPERLTTASVGEALLAAMYELHPDRTLRALDLLANASFWASAGLALPEQPRCVGRLTAWVAASPHARRAPPGQGPRHAAAALDMRGLLGALGDARRRPADPALLGALPERARRLSEEAAALYLRARRGAHSRRLGDGHASMASHLLTPSMLSSLYHGDDGVPSVGEQTVMSGQLASPETLEFAGWLGNNATQNAAILQDMCFVYTSESSNTLDSVASEIQTLVGQVQAALDSLMKYASPAGLERLESQIEAFEKHAVQSLAGLVEGRLASLVNTSLPQLELVLGRAAHEAGEWLGRRMGSAVQGPLGSLLAEPLAEYMAGLVRSGQAGRATSDAFGPRLAGAIANLTSEALAGATGRLLEGLVERALVRGAAAANGSIGRAVDGILGAADGVLPDPRGRRSGLSRQAGATEASAGRAEQQELHTAFVQLDRSASRGPAEQWPRTAGAGGGGRPLLLAEEAALEALKASYAHESEAEEAGADAWGELVDVVRTLGSALPASVRAAKRVRREVSKVSSDIDTVFAVLEQRGQQLFDTVAQFWRTLWVLYFCSLIPLNCYILYYAFWAGGFLGGPTPLPPDEETKVEPPKTVRERLSVCIDSCSLCMKKTHDTELCFWSVIMVLQVVVLILFVASVGLCTLAGIKAFILAGCSQVYILGDEGVCREQMSTLKSFLSTFFVAEAMEPLQDVCGANKLLTCQLIWQKLITSGLLTTAFSVLAALFGLHLIVNSAVLHEQARWRRLAAAVMRDAREDIDDCSVPSVP